MVNTLSKFDLDLQEKVLLAIRSLLNVPTTDATDLDSCDLNGVLYRLGVQLEELPSEEQKEYAREVKRSMPGRSTPSGEKSRCSTSRSSNRATISPDGEPRSSPPTKEEALGWHPRGGPRPHRGRQPASPTRHREARGCLHSLLPCCRRRYAHWGLPRRLPRHALRHNSPTSRTTLRRCLAARGIAHGRAPVTSSSTHAISHVRHRLPCQVEEGARRRWLVDQEAGASAGMIASEGVPLEHTEGGGAGRPQGHTSGLKMVV